MPSNDHRSKPGVAGNGRLAVIICGGLLLLFALLSHFAISSKSATFDEPLHAVSAWLQLRFGDFRFDTEYPPLWKYWAAIPNGRDALKTTGLKLNLPEIADLPPVRTTSNDEFQKLLAFGSRDIFFEWPLIVMFLYQTEGNVTASDGFIARSRDIMLLIGVALGALIAWWSWRLGGVVAAVMATFLFALDPNLLGHAPLVKNDVPLTLATLGLMVAVWKLGRRISVWNALAVALLCAAAVNTKFSALILGPIVVLLLIMRALLPVEWPALGRVLRSMGARLSAAAAMWILCAFVSYLGTWACYQFRFRPAPDPLSSMNMARMVHYTAKNEIRAATGREFPTTQEANEHRQSRFTRGILFLNDHRLFPQAFLHGLLYTYQSSLARRSYLNGEMSITGWWYYFPLAMLMKSPLALIAAAIGALGVAIFALRHRQQTNATGRVLTAPAAWTLACLFVPPAIYLGVAMSSNLNLGLRHIFPVYPFIYIAIGLAASYLWGLRPTMTKLAAGLLAAGLLVESLAAFPDYIAFFGAPFHSSRVYRLGDSNFDWGQDLKLVARWQQEHPDIPLYLCYFGICDPWSYGIDYVNVGGIYQFGPQPPPNETEQQAIRRLSRPGVVAISATHLQGIYLNGNLRAFVATYRKQKPIEVLGGTIYLYPWPPHAISSRTTSGPSP